MASIKFLIGLTLVTIASTAPGTEKCNGACPRNWSPICAKDNTGVLKIFGNKCVFDFEVCENRNENWKEATLEECSAVLYSDRKCNGACTFNWDPICGESKTGLLRLFGNQCDFDYVSCQSRSDNWKKTALERCLPQERAKRDTSSTVTPSSVICDNKVDYTCGINTKIPIFGVFQNPCQLRMRQLLEDGWIMYDGPVEDCPEYFYNNLSKFKN